MKYFITEISAHDTQYWSRHKHKPWLRAIFVKVGKYLPHQGKRECARRVRQNTLA